jgi:hypothetical protein
MRFREETFTRESIQQVIHAHPDLVCYVSGYSKYWRLIRVRLIDPDAIRKLRYGSLSSC